MELLGPCRLNCQLLSYPHIGHIRGVTLRRWWEDEHTLFNDRDVLLCGNHLPTVVSALID